MNIGIIANPHKEGASKTLHTLMELLEKHGMNPMVEGDTAKDLLENGSKHAGKNSNKCASELAKECDVVLVLGGDGTMLDAAQRMGATDTPVAGINIGHLGFLTSCRDDEMELLVKALKEGTQHVVPRSLLHATVTHSDGTTEDHFAVNDITLTRGQTGRLVAMDAYIDGDLLNHYRADGLIIATPTGSTAYSLSAGGPILSPIAQNFVITPICPHSLSNRSLVLADTAEVEFVSVDESQAATLFTVDGQCMVNLEHGGKITINKASHTFNIIRLEGRSFYSTLRQKLKWGS